MTLNEILEQVKQLSPAERRELSQQLLNMPDEPETSRRAKTGAEIVVMLEAMDEPVEFIDPHIEDPVEWVKAQRRKRQEQLKPYWDAGDEKS